ncbi:hypothetical protein CGMCC3_g16776 [Colletotrichum fructicola]|nr:uncharacterized protein CGMCC3_g16776 [Colletotrichum fructicola]KAE9567078.1 hypothetical protein CGMCC3_g16776 [Colletotrichum fructicola]
MAESRAWRLPATSSRPSTGAEGITTKTPMTSRPTKNQGPRLGENGRQGLWSLGVGIRVVWSAMHNSHSRFQYQPPTSPNWAWWTASSRMAPDIQRMTDFTWSSAPRRSTSCAQPNTTTIVATCNRIDVFMIE